MTITNPVVWGFDKARAAGAAVGHPLPDDAAGRSGTTRVARIDISDLRASLRAGMDDFVANRTDVLILCLLYPVIGLIAAQFAVQGRLIPLLFPLASGFAIVGPLAGVGLYEISRRRELGLATSWMDPFRVLRSPAIGSIVVLGTILMALLVLWLLIAAGLNEILLGTQPPAGAGAFLGQVLGTAGGWAMIVIGCTIGFCFAAVAFSIGVVAFPLLLDRDVGVDTAVHVSLDAVRQNPRPMAAWALLVTAALVVGSIPLLLGLPIVLPILGHATWHLYRRVIRPAAPLA
jgi:uncharacterized membrane protein